MMTQRIPLRSGARHSFATYLVLLSTAALLLSALLVGVRPASASGCNTIATGSWYYNCVAGVGNQSNMVEAIQMVLLGAFSSGACDPGNVDGIFGPVTKAAVECFQSRKGLTVDGAVGKNTWHSLQYTLLQTGSDSNWMYFTPPYLTRIPEAPSPFKQSISSARWYLDGLHNSYVLMDTSGPA
jgi:hypothetical protein